MRLVAIYNVWNDWQLLYHSVKNIRPLVDGVIIVASTNSNSGEKSHIPQYWLSNDLLICEPDLKKSLRENETFKRNTGLKKAKQQGYTHFLMLDAAEFYQPS